MLDSVCHHRKSIRINYQDHPHECYRGLFVERWMDVLHEILTRARCARAALAFQDKNNVAVDNRRLQRNRVYRRRGES